MSTPLAGRRQVTLQQKLAVVLFTVTGPLLALDYWQNGGRITFFGVLQMQTLYLLACLGGAISFPLYVAPRNRLLAIIPGALAGCGAFGCHFLYTGWLEKTEMFTAESMIVAVVGASPGIFICWGLTKLTKPKPETTNRND